MRTISTFERPNLRYGLAAQQLPSGDFVLHDPLEIGDSVKLSPLALVAAELFDGSRTCKAVAELIRSECPGAEFTDDMIVELAHHLDLSCLLVSDRLRELVGNPVRRPACLAHFASNPETFRRQLEWLFVAPGGAGMPEFHKMPGGKLRAMLVPHMDYGRGNITYGHAFREVIEQSDARVFVIVGTSHYSPNRFTLTRQHFETPLGLVETDRDYVDRIAEHYGDGLFDDPIAHIPEHSIELEVALLQFLLADRRPFKIVPLLTGSFGDQVGKKACPSEAEDIARMLAALAAAEEACAEPVCYLISGDLAHIGPKFDDRKKATGVFLEQSRAKDQAILSTLEAADPRAFFDAIAGEKNRRRICGLSPAWLTLASARPKSGKVLHYQQYADPDGHESVSFAAVGFYR